MKAAVLRGFRDIVCEDVPDPQPGPGEVVVKVRYCGICGSDVHGYREGLFPPGTVMGHEFAGEVVELGSGIESAEVGDRITIVPLIPCGACDYCAIGEYNLCEGYSYYGSRIDGAMAEYIAVKEDNLLLLPEEVDFDSAACTDPVAVALHAVRKAELGAGDTVAVLGVGPIGGFAIQWARSLGASQVTCLSPKNISPPVTVSRPEIIRNVVVFPQPDGPSRTTNSPLLMVKSIGFTASKSPNFFSTCRSSIVAILYTFIQFRNID